MLAGAPFSFGPLGGVQVSDAEKATLAEMSIALGLERMQRNKLA
jgi:hypothetical protein